MSEGSIKKFKDDNMEGVDKRSLKEKAKKERREERRLAEETQKLAEQSDGVAQKAMARGKAVGENAINNKEGVSSQDAEAIETVVVDSGKKITETRDGFMAISNAFEGNGVSREGANRLTKLRGRESAEGIVKAMIKAGAEVGKDSDGVEIIKVINKKGATPAESEEAQKIIQKSGAEAQQLENNFVDPVKGIAEEDGKIKKTADDFANDLSSISTKKDLLEYLNTLDSVNTGKQGEGVIYFPGYLEKVKNVLAGKSNWSEIGVKPLREKIKELLKKPKTDKKSDKIGNKEWLKQALSQNVDFFKDAISGISDIDPINSKVKEYEDLYKGTNDAADFLGKIRIIADGKISEVVEKQKKEESQKITDETALRTEQLKADFINSLKEIADERDRLEPISPEATVFQLEKKAKGMEIKKEEIKKLGDEVRSEVEKANKKIEERKNTSKPTPDPEGGRDAVNRRNGQGLDQDVINLLHEWNVKDGVNHFENDHQISEATRQVNEKKSKISINADTPISKTEEEVGFKELRKKEVEKSKKLETNIGSAYFAQQDIKDLKAVQKEIKDITKLEELRKEETEIKSRLAGLGAVHIMRVSKELEAVQKQIKDIEEGVAVEEVKDESKSVEKKEDVKKNIIDLDKVVLTDLTKFNFKKENLENIEGFIGLNKSQQLFALAGLNQAILEKAKIDALETYNAKSKEGGWMKKAFTGLTKNYQISNLEKELAQKITKGEGEYGRYLEMSLGALSKIAGSIPGMVEKEGKIEVEYIKKDDFKNLPPHADSRLNELNQIFNQFSKIPQEWSLDAASKDEKKQYKVIAKKYEEAKAEVLQLKLIANGEMEAIAYLSDVENQTKLHQLLNTHPDAEKALAEMSSNKNWMKALNNVVTERGGYAAAGFALRSATISAVGMIGLPVAAAVMGGWMAMKRAQGSLREGDLLDKHGKASEQNKEYKNIVKAVGLISKIKLLENKIEAEKNEAERARLIESLKVRIQYTEDKLTKGLVDYGANEARIGNKYDLFQKLNYAKNLEMASGGHGESGERLLRKLNEYLLHKEGKRSKYLRNKIIIGATFGAAFAAGGYAIRHFAGEWYGGNNGDTDITDKRLIINKNIPGKIEPTEPVIKPIATTPNMKIDETVVAEEGSKEINSQPEFMSEDERVEFFKAAEAESSKHEESIRFDNEIDKKHKAEYDAKYLKRAGRYFGNRIDEQERLKDIARATTEKDEFVAIDDIKSGKDAFIPVKELESLRNVFKISETFDSAERANVGKMTIGKLLAETTEDKINRVQGSGGTEGVIDLSSARAQLSEAEYGRYVQLAKQIRNAKLNSQEIKMTVDDFFKLGDDGIKRIFARSRTR